MPCNMTRIRTETHVGGRSGHSAYRAVCPDCGWESPHHYELSNPLAYRYACDEAMSHRGNCVTH